MRWGSESATPLALNRQGVHPGGRGASSGERGRWATLDLGGAWVRTEGRREEAYRAGGPVLDVVIVLALQAEGLNAEPLARVD